MGLLLATALQSPNSALPSTTPEPVQTGEQRLNLGTSCLQRSGSATEPCILLVLSVQLFSLRRIHNSLWKVKMFLTSHLPSVL